MSGLTDALKSGDVTYGEIKVGDVGTEFEVRLLVELQAPETGWQGKVSRLVAQRVLSHPDVRDVDVLTVRPAR